MELRHLRYFLAVAEELNFSRAAVRLHMAQPPLSQQIRDLEQEVGLQLFDRSSRRVSLTQVGKEFLVDAREVLASVARLENKARLRSQGNLGTLSISVITAMASSKFASMLRAFQKKNSEIKVSLSDHPSTWQVAALTGGTIDVGFLRPPSQIPPLIEIYRIKRDAMQIAVPLGHRLAQRKKIDWKDLAEEGLILVEPELARNYYDGFFALCRKNGVEPRIQQYTGNVATQLWLISAGLGIAPMAITPELVKQNDVVFVGLPSDAPVYETVMAWRRKDSSPVIQRFVQFVKHYLAD